MTMIRFELLHPRMTWEHLGLLPGFFSERDPRPAREQLHANYAHGGGWYPMPNWELLPDNTIRYPGDPPFKPLARAKLRDELIVFYDCAFVAIIQKDRTFEIARVD
jgi:hypothetical protein